MQAQVKGHSFNKGSGWDHGEEFPKEEVWVELVAAKKTQ